MMFHQVCDGNCKAKAIEDKALKESDIQVAMKDNGLSRVERARANKILRSTGYKDFYISDSGQVLDSSYSA